MSGSAAPERDTQLLAIGKQCSAPLCLVVDFLPFKCQHCEHSFCGDHFLPDAHKCDKYDAAKHNRVAPSCPLCNTPVAIPPGQDPNVRMEHHINSECSVMTGRSGKVRSVPVCARAKCGKALYAPISCDSCKQQFCPQHRFPKDHTCITLSTAASKDSSSTKPFTSVSSHTSAASTAAMAAIKRTMVSSTPSHIQQTQGKAHVPTAKPASSSSRTNPFSATDRVSSPRINPPPTPSDDTTNDPPDRCVPKSSTLNAMSFVPHRYSLRHDRCIVIARPNCIITKPLNH
ncbi:AN1-type zinc finger protein 2A [Grifola frondosa]|uniref:AN1-type zinc finger protein 2A n=1 Tax=Grifola frondosa TaxID=5627 RepID=A0A1C7M3V9_GRIFR|nr:AN1-type zinc finger protein 2A [Grifola frondosa]